MLRGFLCMWLIYMYWIFFVLTTFNKACACCFCSVLSLCTYIMCFLHLYSVERGILKGGNQSSLTHADLYRKHNITQGRNCVQLNRASENGSGVTVSTCASLFYQKTKQKSPSLVDYFDLLELSWSWQEFGSHQLSWSGFLSIHAKNLMTLSTPSSPSYKLPRTGSRCWLSPFCHLRLMLSATVCNLAYKQARRATCRMMKWPE